MNRAVRAAILAVVFSTATVVTASAERYYRTDSNWFWRYNDEHYCLVSGINEMPDCSFPTLRACHATNSGLGGTCFINPRHAEAAPSPLRPKRHPRRVRR